MTYCRFGNFCENFIFSNSVKSLICRVKKSRLCHDLPTKGHRVFAIWRDFFCETWRMQKVPNLQYKVPNSVAWAFTRLNLHVRTSQFRLIDLTSIPGYQTAFLRESVHTKSLTAKFECTYMHGPVSLDWQTVSHRGTRAKKVPNSIVWG